jgi:uncharacterized protein (DUF433 family)
MALPRIVAGCVSAGACRREGRTRVYSACPMGEVVQAFSVPEALRLTGLTPRRLAYWDETGFIPPTIAERRGRRPRLYSFRDVVQLRVAAQLRDTLSLQVLRRLKRALDEEVDAPFASLSFAVLPNKDVIYLGPSGQPEDARRPGQIVATFDVPIEEIRTDLARRITKLRSRRGVGRVERQRGVLGSKPTIAGTRVRPETVRRLIADGWSRSRILDEYPDLRSKDISAALAVG